MAGGGEAGWIFFAEGVMDRDGGDGLQPLVRTKKKKDRTETGCLL